MKITITIPENKKDEVIDAFANQYSYQEQVVDETGEIITNPENKSKFALRQVKDFISNIYVASQVKIFEKGRKSVRTTAESDMDSLTVE